MNGADINKSDNYGWTPLNSATNIGQLEIIKLLIENGADIHKADNDGWTPLYSAVDKGHLEIVKLLIENGADINEISDRVIARKAINMQWKPNIHHLYSKNTRKQISTLMKLALKDCQIGRLPKDILLYTCGYVAAMPH